MTICWISLTRLKPLGTAIKIFLTAPLKQSGTVCAAIRLYVTLLMNTVSVSEIYLKCLSLSAILPPSRRGKAQFNFLNLHYFLCVSANSISLSHTVTTSITQPCSSLTVYCLAPYRWIRNAEHVPSMKTYIAEPDAAS
jgi:hypothetical protein